MTDPQLMAALLSYRGGHPILFTIAHGCRLGLDMITPEDEAHFEALVSAQGERQALIMRERVQVIALSIGNVTRAESPKLIREREVTDTEEHLARV